MTAEWTVCFCVCLTLLALWPLAHRIQGSWIGPGGLLCGIWFFASALPLCFTLYFPAHASAYLLLLLFVVVGLIGSSLPMLTYRSGKRSFENLNLSLTLNLDLDIRRLYAIYAAATFVGAAAPIVLYREASRLFEASSPLELAAKITVARYTSDFTQGIVVSLLTMLLFFAALLGGYLSGLERQPIHVRFLLGLWLLPLLLCSALQTTKASVLFGGGLFGAGLVLGLTLSGRAFALKFGQIVGAVLGLAVLAFGFVLVGLMLRRSTFGAESLSVTLPNATVYFVGHMSCFGDWLSRGGALRPSCSAGSLSFGGLFELLHIRHRDAGLFTDMVYFPNGISSNIYTGFRVAIEDFTLPGGLLFVLLLSFAGGVGWVGVLRGQQTHAALFAIFTTYIFISPITSVFVYNTNVGALVLFAVAILAARKHLPVARTAAI